MSKNNIKYFWGDRNLLIKLGNRTNPRIYALYLVEFLVTGSLATLFLIQSLPIRTEAIHFLTYIGVSFLYFLAAYRFLSRMLYRECIQIDTKNITIIKKRLLSKEVARFYWFQIGELHYDGRVSKTDHPLIGKCYDYFGFETQEKLIQTLHHPGNIYFETPEGNFYFAAGVYSWDAEEIVQMMKLYVGNSLKLGPEWEQMLQLQNSDDN